MASYEILAVTEYNLPSDPVEAALEYPGPRPEGSYITDGEAVVELPNTFREFQKAADTQLAAAGLPLIAERIPVLAYGSNANPAQLKQKLSKFETNDPTAMQTVPNCAVLLPNTMAVWHGQPGQVGSYFAELYTGPEAEGTALQTHVGFLTLEQLGALDASEGETYTRIEMPAKIGLAAEDKVTNILAYTAFKSQILLDKAGKPITVASLQHRNSPLSEATPRQVLGATLRVYADQTGLQMTPEEYVAQGRALTLQERKIRQANVGKVLRSLGLSRPYSAVEDNPDIALPRLDFASLPGRDHELHLLPQMVWSAEMTAKNVARAQKELLIRTGAEVVPADHPSIIRQKGTVVSG
jgi:hypothetical protein